MEVSRTSSSLSLPQHKYAVDLLQRLDMIGAKPVSTPSAMGTKLSAFDGELLSSDAATAYHNIVGALQYLTLTRPDLSYAVNQVCQFLHNPTSAHFEAVKRILRYIKGTITLGLHFTASSDLIIRAYSDADWTSSPDDRRSTTSCCVYMGPNLLFWASKKQPTISKSSSEAEYRAVAYTTADVCWLMSILKDFQLFLSSAPQLFCDNISAMYFVANPVFRARTKHIEVDYHFVWEFAARGALQVLYVSTNDQIVDGFTKGLSAKRFAWFRRKLNVDCSPFHLREGVT